MDRRAFHRSISFVFLIFFLVLSAAAPVRAAAGYQAGYQVVAVHEERTGPLLLTETTVQAGDDPVARFTMHRLRKPGAPPRGILLLLPGGGSNFAFYTADENGQLLHSLAGFLAARGFEVWGYSPRTRGLAPGACSGTVDCSGMSDWGMASVVADALYIRERIRDAYPDILPVIGGVSLGAMSTIAVIDATPGDWGGAVIWEGMLYSEDPVVLAANGAVCADLEAQIAAGQIWDEVTYSSLHVIYGLATSDPDGPSPLPGFEGLTNRQVFLLLLTSPQPAPPGYVPGYTLMAGSLEGLTYASEARVGLLVDQLNSYDPLALVRDYTCALGGERTFTSNLGSFTAPVYAIGSGHGFGPWMGDNLELLGSTDVTWDFHPDFAHGDISASPDSKQLLLQPLFTWLRRITDR